MSQETIGKVGRGMTLEESQSEMRAVYRRGSVGQLVTGLVWLGSAALATEGDKRLAIIALLVGGMLIFPLTQVVLRWRGGRTSPSRQNPLPGFALQSVFAMGALYPLVYAAALHNLNWFYPAFLIVVGVHYVSFIFLYGMWEYSLLASILVGSGVALGTFFPIAFSPGAWIGATVLLLFALYAAITSHDLPRHRDCQECTRPDSQGHKTGGRTRETEPCDG